MAKKSARAKSGAISDAKSGGTKSFEEQLGRLEKLGEQIKRNDIPLDEALAAFEEGIRLARSLEKSLEKIENRIEILMNSTEALADDSPELELFNAGE